MTMAKNEASNAVRKEFSKLSLDGKTSFLVEAVFSTAGAAIHEIGERVTSLVELVTGAGSGSDEPAEPETAEESAAEEKAEDAGKASK
jgi:hypothetical protein